ncbi:MAG: hypothetical protein ACRER5_12720, partial [Pseudomonas sp.]
MTMQSNNDDKGLKLQLDTSTDIASDDAAFDDVGIDEELDDSMNTVLPSQRKSRGKAKLMAGVVLVALLGAGGYIGYKQIAGGGAQPVAAIPGDVPVAGADPMAAQPLPGADGAMPAPMDGSMPADPMMAGAVPAADGSMPMPMDGGAMPMDPALDPAVTGIVPPPAPGMPDAVMADGGVMPPADPMMAGQPMDNGDMPIDPMAGLGAPVDPNGQPMPDAADAMVPPPEQMGGMPPADAGIAPPGDVAGIVAPPAPVVTETPSPVVETVAPSTVVTTTAVSTVDPAVAQEMRSKIESLESRIVEMDRELKTLRKQQDEATPAASNSEVTAADLKALERRIDALATKAASAAAAPAPVKLSPPPRVAAPAPAPVAMPETRNTTMVAPATSTVRTAVGTATGETVISAPPARTPVAAPAPTAGKVTQWQLRSAQPGRATLSQ